MPARRPPWAIQPWLRTLRGQLVLRFLAVLAALLLVFATLQYVVLRGFLVQAAADRLRAGARTAVADYQRNQDPAALARAASDPRTVAWVYGPSGRLLAKASPPRRPVQVRRPPASGPAAAVVGTDLVVRLPLGPPPGPAPGPPPGRRPVPAGGVPAAGVPAAGVPAGTLVLSTPLSDVQAVLGSEVEWLVLGGVLALILTAAVGGMVVGHGLRPLENVASTADAVSQGDLTERARVEDVPEEVSRVGRAFNAMLDRLAAALGEERRQREGMRRFLADVSHELRTPLTAIIGLLGLLRAGAGRDRATLEESLATAHTQARRMGSLVDQLLTLARMGQPTALRLEPVDLDAWLQRRWPEVEAAAAGHPVVHGQTGASSPLRVRGDPDALGWALLNLVDNAAKYSPEVEPITVLLERRGEDARVVVTDRGSGIPAQDLPHVFERFYRGAGVRERAAGTGLGLPIVQAVASAHGGRVELSAPTEGGTQAAVILPVIHDAAVDPRAE